MQFQLTRSHLSYHARVAAARAAIPRALRSKILLANRHACCICRRGAVQLHHINADPSDNSPDNLAVLCLEHHDKATAPPGMSAQLRPEEIIAYKTEWETQCTIRSLQVARGRAAFFMVDYKNCERIRQLYSSLSKQQYTFAARVLLKQLQEEHDLRAEQGFDESLEPTTDWSPTVDALLTDIASGVVHPKVFDGAPGHPKDPYFPLVEWQRKSFFLYDLWCQLMVRAIIAASWVYDIHELLKLESPRDLLLDGSLVSFKGTLKGIVYPPDHWQQHPIGRATLKVSNDDSAWKCVLNLKTHYVYSDTAAMSLSAGDENGILLLRSISRVDHHRDTHAVQFQATPLIIGSGSLQVPGVE